MHHFDDLDLVLCIIRFSTSLNYFLASFLMAFFFHQTAFVGHDTGHNGVSGNYFFDHYLGILVGNCLGGLSIGWWKDTHNVHHLITNDPEHDPDIQLLPFLAVTTKLFTNLFSTYHQKVLPFDGASKFFVSIQHKLYYIIMACGRFNLYFQSIMFVITNKRCKFFLYDMGGLLIFWFWFSILVSNVQGFGNKILFVLSSHAMSSLLHIQITISHYSMDTETN